MKIVIPQWLKQGSVIKYENPAMSLTYNADGSYNWEPFLRGFADNDFSKKASNTSIAYNPNFVDPTGKYSTVADLEGSDEYKAFTDYITKNNTNESVLAYLKKLEDVTTGGAYGKHILFDDAGNLVQDWDQKYKTLRSDGKQGYYHLNPTMIEQSSEEEEENNVSQTPPETTNPPIEFPKEDPKKKSIYTGFVTPTLNAMTDIFKSMANAKRNKQKKFPLYQAPYKQQKVTDAYYARQQDEKIANELNARAEEEASNVSDINASNKIRRYYNDHADEYRTHQGQLKANEFAATTQAKNKVDDFNREQGANYANRNIMSNAANFNNIINADNAAATEIANTITDTRNVINTDYRNYTQIQKLNEQFDRKRNLQYQFNIQKQALQNQYQAWAEDEKNSDAWQTFIQALDNGTLQLTDAEADAIGELFSDSNVANTANLSPEQLNLLKTIWNSDSGKTYKDLYNIEADKKYKKLSADIEKLSNEYTRLDNGPRYVDNEPFQYVDLRHTSPAFAKKGTKLTAEVREENRADRFLQYAKLIQKEQDRVRKSYENNAKRADVKLRRDLDAIDRETLTLLRSIFK